MNNQNKHVVLIQDDKIIEYPPTQDGFERTLKDARKGSIIFGGTVILPPGKTFVSPVDIPVGVKIIGDCQKSETDKSCEEKR